MVLIPDALVTAVDIVSGKVSVSSDLLQALERYGAVYRRESLEGDSKHNILLTRGRIYLEKLFLHELYT